MTLGIGRSSATFSLCLAAAALLGGAAVARADGAPPGGNCCVDLEERVSELEATVVRKGNRRVSLTVSGQVATHLMYWSDGGSSYSTANPLPGASSGTRGHDLYIVDNTNAVGGTQFQFAGDAKISPSLTAGFQVAIGLDSGSRSAGSGPSSAAPTNNKGVSQLDDDGSGANADTLIVLTLANWYLEHKEWGRVTVGRANTATAGISTIDLGGTGVIANANLGYWNGNMFLINGSNLAYASWGDIMGHGSIRNSGLSRGNVIEYTSPTFGGFQFAAAWGENDLWDVGLRYAGEYAGFRVAAGIGYISNTTGFGDQVPDIPANNGFAVPALWKGSASVLHVASGLFLTGAYVDRDNDNGHSNTTLWYLNGGIAKNWTGLGNTVFYGEYARVNDGVNGCIVGGSNTLPSCDSAADFGVTSGTITGSEATIWGLGVVQNIDSAAMEIYLSYRRYEAELNTTAGTTHFNDMDVVVGGARLRF
jgi:hypothetical protein